MVDLNPPRFHDNRCHLVQARPGPMLSDILINSPVMVGEDGVPIGMAGGGSGFDFSMDPMAADDPELAMVREGERERVNEDFYLIFMPISLNIVRP